MLRGKKLQVQKNWKEKKDFGIYPKSIFRSGLTAVDKLILIGLHGFPDNWVLAHSRLARQIGCDKSHVLDRWKSLIDKGVIKESPDAFAVDYQILDQLSKVALTNAKGSAQAKLVPSLHGSPKPQALEAQPPNQKKGEPSGFGSLTPAIEYKEIKEKIKEEDKEEKEEYLLVRKSIFFTPKNLRKAIRIYFDYIELNHANINFEDFEKNLVIAILLSISKINTYALDPNYKKADFNNYFDLNVTNIPPEEYDTSNHWRLNHPKIMDNIETCFVIDGDILEEKTEGMEDTPKKKLQFEIQDDWLDGDLTPLPDEQEIFDQWLKSRNQPPLIEELTDDQKMQYYYRDQLDSNHHSQT